MQKKIILVDDNKTFLMYVGLLLKRFGMQVLPVQNGLEALKIIKARPPDLIILDVHMDTFDGIAMLRNIKADRNITNIPVIMISTDMSPETVNNCMELGCSDYLSKPIKVDKLHDSIQRVFFAGSGTPVRKHIRAACNIKVSVSCKGVKYDLYAEMLSEGGVYVRKEETLPIGSDVDVTLHLEDVKTRQFKGKVIYTKETFGDFSALSPGMAIAFFGLSEQERQDMHDYLNTMIAGDILAEQQKIVIDR